VRRLRRSVHFVPAGERRFLERAPALEADAIVLDLEDAVPSDGKQAARDSARDWLASTDLGRRERVVRMNPLETPFGRRDLEVTMEGRPDAYMVPKARRAADLLAVGALLDDLERRHGRAPGEVRLIAIATETAEGVLNIRELAAAPRVDALTWGGEDLSVELGARRNRGEDGRYLDVFRYARSMTLLAAAAAGVQAIDAAFTDLRDGAGLEREAREAAWMGFEGKLTLHPDQLAPVNAAFSPSSEEIRESEALVAAFEENGRAGRSAFRFRGRMVDFPHLRQARALLERARLAGLA
jgi:citrate lyase subunit beta/citryl-CoA lyase